MTDDAGGDRAAQSDWPSFKAAPHRAWKDTVNVARGETVRIVLRQDSPGPRMYHCHILEHEQLGMMGIVDVQE